VIVLDDRNPQNRLGYVFEFQCQLFKKSSCLIQPFVTCNRSCVVFLECSNAIPMWGDQVKCDQRQQ